MAIPHTYVFSRCISSLYGLLNRIFDLRTYIADRRYKGRRVRYGLSWAGLSTPALNSSLRSIQDPSLFNFLDFSQGCKKIMIPSDFYRSSCHNTRAANGKSWMSQTAHLLFWKCSVISKNVKWLSVRPIFHVVYLWVL